MRWAIVNSDNIVENIVIWDGTGDLFSATQNILLEENEKCEIAWSYNIDNDPRFIEPDILNNDGTSNKPNVLEAP